MQKGRSFFIVVMLFFTCLCNAQSEAGKEGFAVLNLFPSAQMTQRGMNFIPRFLPNISTAISNPSTLDSTQAETISLTYTDIFAGSYQGAIHYAHNFPKVGTLGFGLQYINYGSFKQTSTNGDVLGKFYCNDFMLNIAWGRQIEENLYLGVNFKPLFSFYDNYSSIALAFDVSAMWAMPGKNWQAGLIFKNIGRQVKSFALQRERLPFDVQLGFSTQLRHAPIIFYVVADNLYKWNIREDDDLNIRDNVQIDGTVSKEKGIVAFLDNGFRHLHFALDIKTSDYVSLSAGYNWRQHQEMSVKDAFSLAGLSYGLNINYKNYSISYARNEYHNYGSPNYITLTYTFK